MAAPHCSDAISDVTGPSTPAVSHVGWWPDGGSGYTHARQDVCPGITGIVTP
jgi:hypothetical protein